MSIKLTKTLKKSKIIKILLKMDLIRIVKGGRNEKIK